MMRRAAALVLAAVGFAGMTAAADEPGTPGRSIEFDSKLSFPCREVTPKDYAAAHQDRKVVEATIRISANFIIEEKEIESLVYRLVLPDHLEIADYLPKTELASDVSGTVNVDERRGSRTSMMVSYEAGGKVGYRVPGADAEARASAAGRGEKGSEVSSGVQVKFLPPKQLIVAAGTQNRGQTLYFKLRPFSQITLEGEKEFAFLLLVPRDWAGDSIVLDCAAYQKGYKDVAARQAMGVGLYMIGDAATRARVEKLAREAKPSPASLTAPRSQGTAAAPPPAGADGLTLERLAGKYTFSTGAANETTGTFTKDGKWEGWTGIIGLPKIDGIRGTWAVEDGKLIVTQTHIDKIPRKRELISSPIKDYDEKAGVIFLENGKKLSK